MGGFRALLVLAGLTAILAVEIGPLLPTPLPINPSTTVAEKDETKDQTTKLRDDVTVSPGTASSSTIPVLNMMQEEDAVRLPKYEETVSKQGRALNLSASDLNSMANSIHNSSDRTDTPGSSKVDLSDVSMDNDDMDLEFVPNSDKINGVGTEVNSVRPLEESRVLNKPGLVAADKSFSLISKSDIETTCLDSGISYKMGSRVERDCDEVCTCMAGGLLTCEPRCRGPFFRRGRAVEDPLCSAKPVDDPCCAILVCAADTVKDMCVVGNTTYSAGENFNEGCLKVCQCEAGGNVTCTPRCPVLEQRDDCVNIPDPKDSCCKLQLCDVTQDEVEPSSGMRDPKQSTMANETVTIVNTSTEKMIPTTFKSENVIDKDSNDSENKLNGEQTPFVPIAYNKVEPIVAVSLLANRTVQVILMKNNSSDSSVHLELSRDGGVMWTEVQLKDGLLFGLEDGQDYIIRSRESGKRFPFNIPKLKGDNDIAKTEGIGGCIHKGNHRTIDEEFHVGCNELCVCLEGGHVHCMPLVCPSHEGLELIDPTCETWGPSPPSFVPSPPRCCPPAMMCVSNGSCQYKEHIIPNWSEVPIELSGCGQRCFCESGMVECQAVCAPLPALPPRSLHCLPPERPAPAHPSGDTCCKEWACVSNGKPQATTTDKTDEDKDRLKNLYRQNETDKNNLLSTPLFVTLPPNLHKAIEETFGGPFSSNGNKKPTKPKFDNAIPADINGHMIPYFVQHAPQNPLPGKSDKSDTKHYEYPGPFADPNHKPQPPANGLGPFPFIKKHKDKQSYPYETGTPDDFVQYTNPTVSKSKDSQKKQASDMQNHKPKPQHSLNHDDYPINDPYLSGNPLHVPFNPNGPGPGFFNPSATKNHQDLLNILHQANINGNANVNNPQLVHPGAGIYHNGISGGNQVPQGPETIHVYTDGSPIHIEHLLQHIQQADTNQGPYIPYATQPQRPNLPLNQRPGNDGNNSSNQIPSGVGGLPPPPPSSVSSAGGGEGALQVVTLEASSPTSLRLVFSLPSVMVGLQGRVQLRYTDSNNPDPTSWRLQEFAPPGDLLATPQLEFQLGGLEPDTLYRLQAALVLRQLPYVPRSLIYTVRTFPLEEEATMPPVIPIEPNLSVGQVNSTSAQITWRPFTQDELLYIDGVQLRYREIDGKVFSGTPLIHRAVTSYQLEGLKPNTSYEVGIFFIPFLGQHTELQSPAMVRLNTLILTDIYDWSVSLDVSDVTAWGLQLRWTGVPHPTERYVRVWRAVWRAEAARADSSTFAVTARNLPPTANITGLIPGTRYRIWLELYLTNGKVKTSNVKDVMTKPGKPAPQEASVQEGKLLEGSLTHRGDYYSSLVAVAILAALGAMCSLVLLLLLLRRHRAASAPICAPGSPSARSNTALPPYDSPTYKLDLQQETMDL